MFSFRMQASAQRGQNLGTISTAIAIIAFALLWGSSNIVEEGSQLLLPSLIKNFAQQHANLFFDQFLFVTTALAAGRNKTHYKLILIGPPPIPQFAKTMSAELKSMSYPLSCDFNDYVYRDSIGSSPEVLFNFIQLQYKGDNKYYTPLVVASRPKDALAALPLVKEAKGMILLPTDQHLYPRLHDPYSPLITDDDGDDSPEEAVKLITLMPPPQMELIAGLRQLIYNNNVKNLAFIYSAVAKQKHSSSNGNSSAESPDSFVEKTVRTVCQHHGIDLLGVAKVTDSEEQKDAVKSLMNTIPEAPQAVIVWLVEEDGGPPRSTLQIAASQLFEHYKTEDNVPFLMPTSARGIIEDGMRELMKPTKDKYKNDVYPTWSFGAVIYFCGGLKGDTSASLSSEFSDTSAKYTAAFIKQTLLATEESQLFMAEAANFTTPFVQRALLLGDGGEPREIKIPNNGTIFGPFSQGRSDKAGLCKELMTTPSNKDRYLQLYEHLTEYGMKSIYETCRCHNGANKVYVYKHALRAKWNRGVFEIKGLNIDGSVKLLSEYSIPAGTCSGAFIPDDLLPSLISLPLVTISTTHTAIRGRWRRQYRQGMFLRANNEKSANRNRVGSSLGVLDRIFDQPSPILPRTYDLSAFDESLSWILTDRLKLRERVSAFVGSAIEYKEALALYLPQQASSSQLKAKAPVIDPVFVTPILLEDRLLTNERRADRPFDRSKVYITQTFSQELFTLMTYAKKKLKASSFTVISGLTDKTTRNRIAGLVDGIGQSLSNKTKTKMKTHFEWVGGNSKDLEIADFKRKAEEMVNDVNLSAPIGPHVVLLHDYRWHTTTTSDILRDSLFSQVVVALPMSVVELKYYYFKTKGTIISSDRVIFASSLPNWGGRVARSSKSRKTSQQATFPPISPQLQEYFRSIADNDRTPGSLRGYVIHTMLINLLKTTGPLENSGSQRVALPLSNMTPSYLVPDNLLDKIYAAKMLLFDSYTLSGPFYDRPCTEKRNAGKTGEQVANSGDCEINVGARTVRVWTMRSVRPGDDVTPEERQAVWRQTFTFGKIPYTRRTIFGDSTNAMRGNVTEVKKVVRSIGDNPGLLVLVIVASLVFCGAIAALVTYFCCCTGRNNRRAPQDATLPFTVMFTDIQSSTALWSEAPEVMGPALDTHHALIRKLIDEHGGYEVKTIGDAFLVAFKLAPNAVGMAVGLQQTFFAHEWAPEIDQAYRTWERDLDVDDTHRQLLSITLHEENEEAYAGIWNGIRVRIGINTGYGDIKKDETTHAYDYYGTVVNTAARVEAAGHGGQILVTAATFETIKGTEMIERLGIDVKDMGHVELRGVGEPVRLFQVSAIKGRDRFPPMRLDRLLDDDDEGELGVEHDTDKDEERDDESGCSNKKIKEDPATEIVADESHPLFNVLSGHSSYPSSPVRATRRSSFLSESRDEILDASGEKGPSASAAEQPVTTGSELPLQKDSLVSESAVKGWLRMLLSTFFSVHGKERQEALEESCNKWRVRPIIPNGVQEMTSSAKKNKDVAKPYVDALVTKLAPILTNKMKGEDFMFKNLHEEEKEGRRNERRKSLMVVSEAGSSPSSSASSNVGEGGEYGNIRTNRRQSYMFKTTRRESFAVRTASTASNTTMNNTMMSSGTEKSPSNYVQRKKSRRSGPSDAAGGRGVVTFGNGDFGEGAIVVESCSSFAKTTSSGACMSE